MKKSDLVDRDVEESNVEVVEMNVGEPRKPPDKYDGLETQEMAASVSVKCRKCETPGYIIGDPVVDGIHAAPLCPECYSEWEDE